MNYCHICNQNSYLFGAIPIPLLIDGDNPAAPYRICPICNHRRSFEEQRKRDPYGLINVLVQMVETVEDGDDLEDVERQFFGDMLPDIFHGEKIPYAEIQGAVHFFSGLLDRKKEVLDVISHLEDE